MHAHGTKPVSARVTQIIAGHKCMLNEVCRDASEGRWHRFGGLPDQRLRVELLQHAQTGRIGLMMTFEAGVSPTDEARRRLDASGDPFILYEAEPEYGAADGGGTTADVIVGFVTAQGETGSCDLEFRLRALAGPDFAYVLRVSPECGLVPACLGVTLLPVLAMPLCSGIVVTKRGGTASPRAVCCLLRQDVRLAVAATCFSLPPSCTLGRTVAIPMSRLQAADDGGTRALHQLADLDAAIDAVVREPEAKRRAHARNDAIFRELMERVWAPDRVASGLVDPDS